MNSIILRVTSQWLLPCLAVLSLFILYRGHNLPGGGFIGGLVGACGFILYSLGWGSQAARKALRLTPEQWMAIGLLLAVGSGVFGLLMSGGFMTGEWLPGFALPLLGKVHLGTPLVFDIGVYFVVIGFSLLTMFSLSEVEK